MNKIVKKKDENSSWSRFLAFWSTVPGLLTGIAALITAIGGLYLASLPHKNGSATPSPQPTAQSPSPNDSNSLNSEDCFTRFFAGIPQDRISTMEAGTVQFSVIKASQPKDPVIGIKFTESKRAIGAIRLLYIPDNAIFKVESLVDGKCQTISSETNVLQMLTPLLIRLNNRQYALTLDYKAGEARATFQLESPS